PVAPDPVEPGVPLQGAADADGRRVDPAVCAAARRLRQRNVRLGPLRLVPPDGRTRPPARTPPPPTRGAPPGAGTRDARPAGTARPMIAEAAAPTCHGATTPR